MYATKAKGLLSSEADTVSPTSILLAAREIFYSENVSDVLDRVKSQ
jgi:hypothetical protein